MTSLAKMIEKCAGDEDVLAAVIGDSVSVYYDTIPGYAKQPRNIVLSWDAARPHISYKFDPSGDNSNHVIAWTESRVIYTYVTDYYFHTYVRWLPRNPTDTEVADRL